MVLAASGLDGDGDALTYAWSQVAGPTVMLDNSSTANGSFTPAASVVYRFSVVASDGYNASPPAFINVSIANRIPVALVESPELFRFKGETVYLNGSGSDPDGDTLTYQWAQVTGNTIFSEPKDERAVSFIATKAERFRFSLTVNDSEAISPPFFVNLTVWSRPPVASLSANMTNTTAGNIVMFDASGSADSDGNITAYSFDFGDGNRTGWQTAPKVEHAYTGPGNYSTIVSVRDDDGNETTSAALAINVRPPNRQPRITSVPPVNATVGLEYSYTVTASNEDGDTITFSLSASIAGMSINVSTGRFTWTPTASQKGKQTVTVKVSDGHGGEAEQTFNVTVSEEAIRPEIALTSPWPGATAGKKLTVKGTAMRGTAPLMRVEVRLDNGTWQTATGTVNWNFKFDTTKLKDGRHIIEARADDGTLYSDAVAVDFVVDNRAKPVDGGTVISLWILLAAIIIAVAGIAAGAYALRKRGGVTPPSQPAVWVKKGKKENRGGSVRGRPARERVTPGTRQRRGGSNRQL